MESDTVKNDTVESYTVKNDTVESDIVDNTIIDNTLNKYVVLVTNHDLCTPTNCKLKIHNDNDNDNDNGNDNDNDNDNGIYCSANFCVSCKINLGDTNPRQYCRKTYCPF